MPLTAATVLGIGSGIGKLIAGAKDVKKAKSELAGLSRPFYRIQDEYLQNRNLAGQMAQSGLPAATKDFMTLEGQRGLGSTFGAMSQTGGNPNDYARVLDVYNQSINRTAAQDAATQIENIRYFMNVNKDLAGQKNMQWSLNEFQPYQNQLKEITQRIAAGRQNMWGGVDQAIGSVAAFGVAKQNQDMYSKLFGREGGRPTDPNLDYQNWKAQMIRDNSPQGNYVLPDKFNTQPSPVYNVPDSLGLSEEQLRGLYQYLNRGR